MSKKHIPTPNLIAEALLSICGKFLIFLVLNNILWAVLYFRPTAPRVGDTRVEITQNGNHDIKQEIRN